MDTKNATPEGVASSEGLGSADLVARMRGFEIDHQPSGWPAVQMRDISALCDRIESLQRRCNDARQREFSSLRLVTDLRWALGDHGKLMQLELLEHAAAAWRDANALRAAVKCEMDVFVRSGRWTEVVGPMVLAVKVEHGADPLEATRRAIERVAASMGALV